MNQPLQHDTQAAVVALPVNVTCKTGNVDKQRLVFIAEEMPIAFRYNGFSHAVMMATPDDLEDFAVGFSCSEGIIDAPSDIGNVSVCRSDEDTTIDICLDGKALHHYLASRRVRQLRGRTSCGLCGVEDLNDVRRAHARVRPAQALSAEAILSALTMLRQRQPLSRLTRGAHASAWVTLEVPCGPSGRTLAGIIRSTS
jgi:FdhD protein